MLLQVRRNANIDSHRIYSVTPFSMHFAEGVISWTDSQVKKSEESTVLVTGVKKGLGEPKFLVIDSLLSEMGAIP
jgi:hypothetical protein